MMDLSLERQLPEELLDRIVSLVVPRVHLRNICLTSKTFNRLATPYLYSTITVGYGDRVDDKYQTWITSLAYLFFTTPSLAALVENVLVQNKWGQDEDNQDEDNPHPVDKISWPNLGTPGLESMLKQQCAKFSGNKRGADEIYAMIESGTNENAILALLLFSLPNMRRLDINFGWFDEHADFHKLIPLLSKRFELSDDQPHVPLDVIVKGEDDKYPNHPDQLTTMLHMPRLRAIYGWRMGDYDGGPDLVDGEFARLKPHGHHVKTIELRCSKLHKDNFRLLMDATVPGVLKTFNYEVGYAWAWVSVEHPAIMKGLAPHHNTLENLGLSHEDFYPYQFDNDSEQPYPCSFVQFKALKRLKVAPVYIWGHEGFNKQHELAKPSTKEILWQALPESLEELWITRALMQELPSNLHPDAQICQPNDPGSDALRFEPACLLPALELVVQHKSDSLPKLSHLRIELPPLEWGDEWFDALSSLCATAIARGVQTTVILYNLGNQSRTDSERGWGWNEEEDWGVCCHNQEDPKKLILGHGRWTGEMVKHEKYDAIGQNMALRKR
jgi:hypothetical protein